MINQLQGRKVTQLKPCPRWTSVGISPCWDNKIWHMGDRKKAWILAMQLETCMEVWLRSTEIPVSPHCISLLQGVWTQEAGTECLAEKGIPSSPSTPQSSSCTSPPAQGAGSVRHTGQDSQGSSRVPSPCVQVLNRLSPCLSHPSCSPALTGDRNRNAWQALPNGLDTDSSYEH